MNGVEHSRVGCFAVSLTTVVSTSFIKMFTTILVKHMYFGSDS